MRTPLKNRVVLGVVLAALVFAATHNIRAELPQAIGSWASLGTTPESRVGAAAVILKDGRTVIAGGSVDSTPTDSVVVFDPNTGSFSLAGHLLLARVGHTATLLDDGRILIAGGTTSGDLISADLELFDPVAGVSVLGGAMTQPRSGHAAAKLADGKVLIVGGNNSVDGVLRNAEVWDPETGTATPTVLPMLSPRTGASATTLIDGRVLVAGGNNGNADLKSAEIFEPSSQIFEATTTTLSFERSGHAAVLLPNNNSVLIAGGSHDNVPVSTSDLFVPAEFPDPYSYGMGSFAQTGDLLTPRAYAVASPHIEGYAVAMGGGAPEAEVYRFPTVKTDKDDYAPGTKAIITGSGWEPDSEVTLVFQEDPAVHDDYVLLHVPTDGQGNFSWNQWAPEEHDLNVRFYLMAKQVTTSGERRAQTTFTDSRVIDAASLTYNAVTVSCPSGSCTVTPLNVPSAASLTGTITVTGSGSNNNQFDWKSTGVTFSLSSTPPASGSDGTCVETPNHTAGGQNTEPFSVTGPMTAGTYYAHFRAYRDDGCVNATGASAPSNPLTITSAITVDATAPTVVSINRNASSPTNASNVSWTVTFSETVTGVDATDFSLANSGLTGPAISTVTGSNSVYTVTASTGTGDGTLGLDLNDNDSIVDAVNNKLGGTGTGVAGGGGTGNGSFVGQVYSIDKTAPTVTINQAVGQADPTNTSPINFTVVFSESVSDFAASDVTLSGTAGATTATVTGGGTTYNVAVSGMTSDGTVIATLAAGVAHDTAGNANTASTSTDNTVTRDASGPTVTIDQAGGQADPTNTSPINFTVVFSESVSDFGTSDVTLSGTAGATTATVSGSGTTYNVAVSGMTSDGTVIATLAAGVAHDAAGNANTASTSTDNMVTRDTSSPTVTINQAGGQGDPTNTSPINFTVIFSESVSDFATGDVTLSGTAGATTATVTGSGTTYNVAVSGMTSDGTVIATLAATVAHDAAGNANTASTSTDNTVTYDGTAPTVTINQEASQADPTNGSPINFTVVFSEPVSDFANGDVTLSGTAGATTAAVTGSGTTYNVVVSGMTTDGTVIALIGADVAHDAAGNGNTASTSTDNTVTYDTTAPTVTINQAGGQADPTNASPINFTVVFSEPVSDLATGDVTLSGTAGATTATVTGNGTTYNVAVSGMTTDGTVIAALAAGVAHDAAGNANTASTSADNTVTYDTTAPTVMINQAGGQADPTNSSPINFAVVFSEPVSDFATGDVTLSGTAGATTATVTGAGTTYNVAVSGMTGDGTVIASIAAAAAHDAAGNANTASTSTDNTVTYDGTAPTVTINQASGQVDPTNASPINFTVVFSEPVSDFAIGDVTLSGTAGATTATVTGSGTTYNVAVSGMTMDGTVIATLAAGVAHDAAGNANTESTSTDNTVTYDTTPPTVTINQAVGQVDPTNSSPINFTVVFSEPVSDFATGDVTLSGTAGATTATVTGGGMTYNVAVSGMAMDGPVIAALAAGVAHDAAGNANTASTSTDNTVTYDTTAPTVTINQAVGQADPTNASPINFTVVFNESVSDFATGDVMLSGSAGATTATVTGSGTTYNVAVSGMTGDGTVVASIASGAAYDGAGNGNGASTSTDNTVTYDGTAPTVTINQAIGQVDPTNGLPINFTVVFSEPVSDFATGDVTLSGTAGATTATVTGSGTTYNVAVSGMSSDGTVIASIGAGVAHDGADNTNAASTSTDNMVTFDTTAPTVTVNQASGQADPTNGSPINFTVVFSEPVSDFATGDVMLNGTAGATTATVTGSGTTYNLAVSGMSSDGTVISTLVAAVAHDAAGNANTASTSTDNTVTYDATAPTVTINQASGQADPTNGSPINFTVVFSEPASDFATGDVTLSGTAGATTAIVTGGGTTYNVAVSGMAGNGMVVASIGAGVAHDAAGNGNTASTSTDNTVTYDGTAPTVTINQASGQTDPTNGSPINFTVIFNEPVSDFATGDVTLTGTAGATTAAVTGSGTIYNVAVSGMTTGGTVIASIGAGVAHDAAGNDNVASTSTDNTVTYTPVVYDLLGLFEPYADPSHRSFKAGSTVPLKWQYTRDGSLFDSGSATPVVNVYGPVACGTVSSGDTVAVNDAGSSGLRYDSASKTWQFNWKTSNSLRDCYYIQISNSTLGVTTTFPIKMVK